MRVSLGVIASASTLVRNVNRSSTAAAAMSTSSSAAASSKRAAMRPPTSVRGMTRFDAAAFEKTVDVPVVAVRAEYVGVARKVLDPFLLRMPNLRNIVDASGDSGEEAVKRKIVLDPDLVGGKDLSLMKDSSLESVSRLAEAPVEKAVKFEPIKLTHKNWRPGELLDAVLEDPDAPGGPVSGVNSWSSVGHVIHVNLRENQLPQKEAVGGILLRTVKNCRSVVNKTSAIDSEFRNFKMELLAGEEDYLVTVKENGCTFRFDFSKVYWNPRLSTEHQRVVDSLSPDDDLFDVFAGVGPFAVPAAKKLKRGSVNANDLNPESHRWLEENCKLNKVETRATCHNLDGRDFVRQVVGPALTQAGSGRVQVAMNLPAMATEFLDAFSGLLQSAPARLPFVRVYAFAWEEDLEGEHEGNYDPKAEITARCEGALGSPGCLASLAKVNYVRNVAPNKGMFRADFEVPESVLVAAATDKEVNGSEAKKARTE